jgi:glycosyltransferase involved in cell wall biosynthesis
MRISDHAVLEHLGVRYGEYILSVGRIESGSGFHDLIEAFERARPRRLKLLIAGAAPTTDAYCARLLAKRSERIIFAGLQTPATLRLLYDGAALFVLASHKNDASRAIVEALAAGAPVLLSNTEGNLALDLEPHAYFERGDVDALAEILSEKDYERFRFRRAGPFLTQDTRVEIPG